MKRYVIRHGETGVKRGERSQYGKTGPPIDAQGKKQSIELGKKLVDLGVEISSEPVAVSEYLRTRQTAELAGFKSLHENPLLNEVFTGLTPGELKSLLERKQLPDVVLEKARAILDNPPVEKVWITHGLVIMGLRQLLGTQADPFDPPKCEVFEMEI